MRSGFRKGSERERQSIEHKNLSVFWFFSPFVFQKRENSEITNKSLYSKIYTWNYVILIWSIRARYRRRSSRSHTCVHFACLDQSSSVPVCCYIIRYTIRVYIKLHKTACWTGDARMGWKNVIKRNRTHRLHRQKRGKVTQAINPHTVLCSDWEQL